MSDVYQNPDKKAKELGLVVRRPEPDELFVDLDGPDARERFDRGRALLTAIEFGHDEDQFAVVITPSRRPGHEHAVVNLHRPLDPYERIAYQLLLGSDPTREVLAMGQIGAGLVNDAVVFFEKP